MGLALAQKFASLGYQLVLVARRTENLAALEAELLKSGAHVTVMSADLADENQIASLFNILNDQVGSTEVLIYNASAYRPVFATQVTMADLKTDMALSVGGVIIATQAVMADMTKAGKGTILITGGGSAITPMPGAATLSMGKAALRNLTLQLHAELAPKGIHVATVTICGWIKPDTHFAPIKIAEVYAQLHQQPTGQWQPEYIYQ
jgi:short-subunit dehydrogenase